MARITLERWIRDAMTDDDKEGQISAIALMHHVGAGGTVEKEVHTIRFGGSKRWQSKDAAELLKSKAEAYAQDLAGVQQFSLIAFYGKAEPEARHPFTLHGEPEFNGMSTEGPTGAGLTQQAMRHMEAVIQMNYRQTGMLFESSQNMLRIQAETNAKLLSERNELLEMLTKLALAHATGQHDFRMKEIQEMRASEERKQLLQLAPALVNSVFGHEVFPQGTADSALIEALAEELDEQKIGQLSAILPAKLWGPMAARLTELIQARNRRQETGEKLLQNGLDPEADAAGEIN